MLLMRTPSRYSVLIALLILIGITSFVVLWNMIPAKGIAFILLVIVSVVTTLSLIGTILSATEIYKAKDLKHRIINITCLVVSLTTFLIPITFNLLPNLKM
ncbi:hypothetical protein BN990_03742 [Virgibacillus salexigens]|uniref:Uncharacterized protein n=1 Tax=Virgibacillus massiliensis TaxID=1462526 RepID=A0A024QGL4_9BACI|nr:hypothetical protein BN990_03742 [Virgibacillus massiliensis]